MTALPSTRSSMSGIQEQHVDCKGKKFSATAMANGESGAALTSGRSARGQSPDGGVL
jgi:hypothetical protein